MAHHVLYVTPPTTPLTFLKSGCVQVCRLFCPCVSWYWILKTAFVPDLCPHDYCLYNLYKWMRSYTCFVVVMYRMCRYAPQEPTLASPNNKYKYCSGWINNGWSWFSYNVHILITCTSEAKGSPGNSLFLHYPKNTFVGSKCPTIVWFILIFYSLPSALADRPQPVCGPHLRRIQIYQTGPEAWTGNRVCLLCSK